MTLRCPTCGVGLRLNEERLAGRSSAKCPQCRSSVPLVSAGGASSSVAPPASVANIRIECASCGAKLRAPAAAAASRSHCPKCRAEIIIRASAPAPAARTPPEETSGAATRRIASSALDLPGVSSSRPKGGGMDLDAFIKSGEATPSSAAPVETAGIPRSILKPPVAEMEKIAGEIRLAARSFDPAAPSKRAESARPVPDPPEATTPKVEPRQPRHSRAPGSSRSAEPFPASRGLLFGALAGLLVGGASIVAAALMGAGSSDFISPLPVGVSLLGGPERALRVLLPALLGAMAGFIAAAAGSPTRRDRPLSLLRGCGFALLTGLACGLVTSLSAGEGLKVWPIANWMRDLLAVGVLTATLNRFVPEPR